MLALKSSLQAQRLAGLFDEGLLLLDDLTVGLGQALEVGEHVPELLVVEQPPQRAGDLARLAELVLDALVALDRVAQDPADVAELRLRGPLAQLRGQHPHLVGGQLPVGRVPEGQIEECEGLENLRVGRHRPQTYHEPVAHSAGESDGSASRAMAARQLPWSRSLLLLAVVGPPLWLGGVKPWTVPAFVLVVCGLLIRRCLRSDTPVRMPALWWLGLLAAGLTFLQWVPLPSALLRVLAPELSRTVAELIDGSGLDGWSRLSVHPGQTGLEVARLLGLTGLFVAAAQLSWRLVAAYVSLAGTLVAVIGLAQKLVGVEAIYGVYVPRQDIWGLGQALGSPLLTSFVNPNHQSGLLLVGIFAAAATAVELHARARETRGRQASERLADRAYLTGGALVIQVTALVLSMSRAALVSIVLVAPLALFLIARAPRPVGSEPEHEQRRRLAFAVLLLGMLALALTQGAWDQLASLRDPAEFDEKFRVALEGLALIPMSPVLGIGRGAFVDLFPLVDTQPTAIQFTHLESTPLAWLVEWGPVPGGVLLLGVALWWLRSFAADRDVGRRLVLCGLLALAIQSCADFSLDYLGVTAAAVALAGAVGYGARGGYSHPTRRVLAISVVATILALAIAVPSIPDSWSHRRDRDRAVLDGTLTVESALRSTPLDPFLHLAWARALVNAGDWEAARSRAEIAIRLRPSSLDAHLLAATAAAHLGAPLASIEHVRRGLEGLREPVPDVLIEWLIASVERPEQLAELAPDSSVAWTALARALNRTSPVHGRALASARTRSHPDEPEPLRQLAVFALDANNPGLALHYARLLVQLSPDNENAQYLRARARFSHRTRAQDQAAVAELELARKTGRFRDPGVVDEQLIIGLLRLGDAESLLRAEQLLDGLLARRAEPKVRERRQQLAADVRAARARE
jgi:tetratricopeptide (TPR) repeat protein